MRRRRREGGEVGVGGKEGKEEVGVYCRMQEIYSHTVPYCLKFL